MEKCSDGFIPPHGGYRSLVSYRKAEIVYDATVRFCDRFVDRRSRTHDQMVQAARSGKQNIIEGSRASGTSKESEIKLLNVARASLEELLADFHDYLRVNDLPLWDKNSSYARKVRSMGRCRAGRWDGKGPRNSISPQNSAPSGLREAA